MKQNTINATDNMLIGAVRRLYEDGEITIHQYAESLRRVEV